MTPSFEEGWSPQPSLKANVTTGVYWRPATVVERAPTDCEGNKVAGVRSAALLALLVLH